MSTYYTYYVSILGVTEDVFWYSDLGFIAEVAGNKQAFDAWIKRQSARKARR